MHKGALIYVAGHSGLIGSAIIRKLEEKGFNRVITRTHKELDLTNRNSAEAFFRSRKPEYVFLAAARVGGIHSNYLYPAEFIYDNIMIQANVIDLAFKYGVKKLLFLASSCVYPKLCPQPMKEKYILTGAIEPTNEPFAIAKLAGMKMCQAYKRQYGADYICAIPANVYGVNDHLDNDSHVLSALLKKFHQAKLKKLKKVVIWGTGNPKREFLNSDDLAWACIFLMQQYSCEEPINVGTAKETSIKELARLIQKITGFNGKVIYDRRRPDGNPARLLDSGKIKKMGWKASISLEQGLITTYNWLKKAKKRG